MTPENAINTAIRECLQRCYRSKDSIATLAVFVEKLKNSEGWTAPEIRSVEMAVLSVLRSIVHGATYPGDATNRPISSRTADRHATRVDRPLPPQA